MPKKVKYKLTSKILKEYPMCTDWVETPGGVWEWACTDSASGLIVMSRRVGGAQKDGKGRFEWCQGGEIHHVNVTPRPTRVGLVRIARKYAKEHLEL